MDDHASRRYAQALFLAAEGENAVDRVEADLSALRGLWESFPDLGRLLGNPDLGRREKGEFLDRVFPGGMSPVVRRFLDLLLVKKRIGIFPEAVRDYHDIAEAYRGQSEAEVVTRAPLGPEQRRTLADRLGQVTGKEIRLVEKIDPGVIGGVRVQIRDRVIDGTLRFHLAELRESLLKTHIMGLPGDSMTP
jgi:F-type H+-transporting ATPase subunit delta